MPLVASAMCMASYFAARSPGTIAHKSYPFGTQLLVENLGNGRSARGTVLDRGPFIRGRCVDVSVPLAGALGMRGSGVARVRVTVLAMGYGGRVVGRLGRRSRTYTAQPPVVAPKLPTIFDIF